MITVAPAKNAPFVVVLCLFFLFFFGGGRSKGKGMMDLGAIGRGTEPPPAFGSAYGLLANVATTLCPADILSLVRAARQRLSRALRQNIAHTPGKITV